MKPARYLVRASCAYVHGLREHPGLQLDGRGVARELTMKASDEAIRLLDQRQLDAGMLRLHLRHEFFNVPHQLELCHGWKGATDASPHRGSCQAPRR